MLYSIKAHSYKPMNDQLQKQLAEILNQMQTAVSQTADFSLKQLPDIATHYIHYGFWSNLLSVIISGAFIIACVFSIKLCFSSCTAFIDDDTKDLCLMICILGGCLVFLLKFYPSVESLLLNITAPKVWLILEIKKILS